MARIALVHDIAGVAAVQAELLRAAGHQVDQLSLPELGASWSFPAKAFALPLRVASYLPTAARLRAHGYDIVHIHWLANGIVGMMSGRGFVVQAHGSDLHVNMENSTYRRVTHAVLKRARMIFYVTPNLREYLRGYENKLVYLPNPVDMRGIAQNAPPPSEVRSIVFFTRLHPVKGIDRMFPAAERLSRFAELTAIDWGPEARKYTRMYDRWVRFVKPVPHPEIGDFLKQFDLVIGQMRQGILSLMEIEALGAGRPLITGVDWHLYPVDPPPAVAATDADGIVAAVERLRRDSEELARLSRLGRDWAVRNHSYAHHVELLQKAYFGSSPADPIVSAGRPR